IESLLSTLKDAETGQRGFMLMGVEGYLEPYNVAVVALPRQFEQVHRDVADDPAQARRLSAVQQLVAAKMAELERTVALKRADRNDAAIEIVRSDRGRDLMDRIRAGIDDMLEAERAQLESRTRLWQRESTISTTVTWVGSALLLLLVGTAAVMSSGDFREQ